MDSLIEAGPKRAGPYRDSLGKRPANYAPLSPLSFLPKAGEAFADGWLHTGDLAVIEPDGYVRIKDRSKDVIISGGENISSIEVEDVLHRHPAVDSAAVVAKPDAKWGEVPCAFVQLNTDASVSEVELRKFCRDQMAGYKVPRYFVFEPIAKNATGKVQKDLLRKRAKDVGEAAP